MLHQAAWEANELDHLLRDCGDRPRGAERWGLVLERSAWHLAVRSDQDRLVGFIRATSDQALNANLWDLLADPADPNRDEVIQALVLAFVAAPLIIRQLYRIKKPAGEVDATVFSSGWGK